MAAGAYGDEISIDTSELDGLAELLERFPLEVQNQMLSQALGAGASVVQIAIIQAAPVRVDPITPGSNALKEPGMVKADIRVAKMKNGRGWLIGASSLTAYVVRWLELGYALVKGGHAKTDSHGGGTGVQIGSVPGHPFLRPAFDASWHQALSAIALELQNRIAEYWRRTSGRMKKSA